MHGLHGVGLGFRRELIPALKQEVPSALQFFELAPENWIGMGGQSAKDLRYFTERYPFVCHGLSLSLGGSGALDVALLKQIKAFMHTHEMSLYTEHLSWCADEHHLYELLPIPCTEEAVHWTAQRIRQAQDILEQPIGLENASYYIQPPHAEMTEAEFIGAVVRESGCLLHLDVNNIHVNSRNFGFDALNFLKQLPLERTCYIHVAGHYVEPDGFVIDTHGAAVVDPVWALLEATYAQLGQTVPTCLERDFNIPALDVLAVELQRIQHLQNAASPQQKKTA